VVHVRELQAKALRAKNGDPKPDAAGVFKGTRQDYKIEDVIGSDQGLKVPWAIDWLPDGRMLITNRPGFMILAKDGKVGAKIEGLPESKELGQGGLMDVAVHPEYARSGWIYLAYSEPGGRGAMTKIVRGKLDGSKWTSQQTIWRPTRSFTPAQGFTLAAGSCSIGRATSTSWSASGAGICSLRRPATLSARFTA